MIEIALQECMFGMSLFGKKITLGYIQEITGIHRTILSRFCNQPRTSIKADHLDKLIEFFYAVLKDNFLGIDEQIPSLLDQYNSKAYKTGDTNSDGKLIFTNGQLFEPIYAKFGHLFPNPSVKPEMRDREFCSWVHTNLIQFFPDFEISNYIGLEKVKIDHSIDVHTLWYNHTNDLKTVYMYSKPDEIRARAKNRIDEFFQKTKKS